MLNFDMKRKIQSLRDILVGKVPDPKTQVEQITLAMIYKFMDDIDLKNVNLGGNREYFKGNYKKYSWSNIMDTKNSATQRFELFSQGIIEMVKNDNLPQLFRDIFRGAYIPYRDVHTCNMFLKEINDFKYSNSEDLGNAYEMLLMIMGSQGDAGQFRTPRHIIDMMVDIVEPTKTDSILDPACGTAGFLVSAYKFIMSKNKGNDGRTTLTSTEKKKLAGNFCGYDISPDMVRLSRVNMYLHNFTKPNINEYDTLTSLDRWDDKFDVVLANPPFMTPKGGIIPHGQYRVQAKRAEVLFVDYIAEHLSLNGRAGVIVPEGIVFQSGTSYKSLREFIIKDNLLYAVISLPAGVFNPYSGVKTSILLFDKTVGKKRNKILFVKINNDGFDLGAQRREIKDNDIPRTIDIINRYKKLILKNKEFELSETEKDFATLATIEDISQQDYILVGERYKQSVTYNSNYPMVELGEIVDIQSGLWKGEKVPLVEINILRNTNFTKDGFLRFDDIAIHSVEIKQLETRKLQKGDIILEKSGGSDTQAVGRVALFNLENGEKYSYSNFTSRIRKKENVNINETYLWAILNHIYQKGVTKDFQSQTSGIRNLNVNLYKQLKIPLPPLSIQEEIVSEIDSYQKIIDGARQIVENYKPKVKIDPEWETVCVSDLFEPELENIEPQKEIGSIKFIGLENIESETGNLVGDININIQEIKSTKRVFKKGSILYGKLRPKLNKVWYAEFDGICSTDFIVLYPKNNNILSNLYVIYMRNASFNSLVLNGVSGAQLPRVDTEYFFTLPIKRIPLSTQQKIVAEIETEQALVEPSKKLIEIFTKKIEDKIKEVFGEQT